MHLRQSNIIHVGQQPFIFQIQTTSPNQTFTLPLENGAYARYNFKVNWGDGSSQWIISYGADRIHTYAIAGTYTIKIIGQLSYFSFYNVGDKLLLKKIISWGNIAFRKLNFYGCSNIIEMPNQKGNFLRMNTAENIFRNCTSLTNITPGLFKNCSLITTAQSAFEGCTSLTTIPDELFYNCNGITTFIFCFKGCTFLTTIGNNIFKTNITTVMSNCFDGCTSLTTVPSTIFNSIPLCTSFGACFQGCTFFNSIPANLFDNCVNATNFEWTFSGCTSLTSIPAGLFDNNVEVLSFSGTFWRCPITNIPTNLFYYNK